MILLSKIRNKITLIIISMYLVNSCIYMCRKHMGSIKTRLISHYQWNEVDLGYLDLSVSIPAATGTILLGYLTRDDRPHYILIVELLVGSLAISIIAFWTRFYVMIATGVIIGLAFSQVIPAGNFFIREIVKKENLTLGTSFYWTSTSVGAVLSLLLVNFSGSMQSCFMISTAISLTVVVLSLIASKFCYKEIDRTDTDLDENTIINKLKISQHKSDFLLVMAGSFGTGVLFNMPYIYYWTTYFVKNYYDFSLIESGYLGIIYEFGFASSTMIVALIHRIKVFKNSKDTAKVLPSVLSCH